jgi:hypothetical protein
MVLEVCVVLQQTEKHHEASKCEKATLTHPKKAVSNERFTRFWQIIIR